MWPDELLLVSWSQYSLLIGCRTGGRVCVRATRGVPSCILNIERVEANMEVRV